MRDVRVVFLTLAIVSALPAATIISVTDSDPDTPGSATISGGGSVPSGRALGVSWIQSETFNNVEIAAAVGAAATSGTSSLTAYLTTDLPTTAANEVAVTAINVPLITPNTAAPLLSIFSGLTLGPGTYYLTIFYSSGVTPSWDFESTFTTSSDVGATLNGMFYSAQPVDTTYLPSSAGFANAGTFGPGFFTVTGDAVVPEPSTYALAGIGLLGIALRCRRRTPTLNR